MKGFILTADARDEGGNCVLRYWGIGEEGPFAAVVDSHRPVFFVDRDAEVPPGLFDQRQSLELESFDGRPVDGLYFSTLSRYWEAKKRLTEEGIRCHESDVRPEARYLMERFIHSAVEIEGERTFVRGLGCWHHPRMAPAVWRPSLRVCSLDIETGQGGELYSAAVHIWGRGEELRRVFVLAEGEEVQGEIHYVATQERVLEGFLKTVEQEDPDVLIGWHVIGFDLAFLERKARSLRIPFLLGRGSKPLRLVERKGSLPLVDLEGRLVIDGPPAIRGTRRHFSDWRLETVGRELLGRGKMISAQGMDKVAEIERQFREDKQGLAQYNLEDAVLVSEIFQKTGVLERLLTQSLITGLPPDQVHRSIAAFDWFFLPRIHRKGLVANNSADVVVKGTSPGGMVFTRGAGLFEDVVVMDFKSLYPTIMRTFRVDPLARLRQEDHPITTPVGFSFSRTQHILPAYLAELMERRAEARQSGDEPLGEAIKILMNSMYGVMSASGCRFYHADLPAAVTGIGRWILETSIVQLENRGYQVLYGDTDSLFVTIKPEEKINPDKAGRQLVRVLNDFFRELIQKDYGVASRLDLVYEKRYLRLFLPVMRGSGSNEGVVRRYAGLLPDNTVEIKGMEYVRSDSTLLAREFQHELFRRYFAREDLSQWIRDVTARLRQGEMDDKLVYRRRLARPAGEYKKNVPPHVRALRMLDPQGTRGLRRVEYVITTQGPVPLELNPKEIDYNHYVERQLKPLADDVLTLEGESFDQILGGRQLDLFGS